MDRLDLANLATKRDISDLLIAQATLPGSPYWLKAGEYRRKLGMGQTKFSQLKKLGKFDGGTDPATLGTKRIRIHAWWSYMLQRFVAPGAISKPINRRKNHGKNQTERTI